MKGLNVLRAKELLMIEKKTDDVPVNEKKLKGRGDGYLESDLA